MKIDKDFDFNGFNKEAILKVVSKADDLFQEKIEENGLLLCKIDRADIFEYEAIMGQTVLEASKEIILFYSKDGTLESGLNKLTEISKLHDGPDYVGYLLITDMRRQLQRT